MARTAAAASDAASELGAAAGPLRCTAGIGVLGPVEVRPAQSGGWRPVPGTRPRSLLARLVAASGRVVLTERLLSDVWPDEPPAMRAKAVAQVVHRLRRLLGDRHAVLIATRPQGYELRVPDMEIDAIVAGLLVERGRARLACGDAASASALLGRALGMWRGEPYDGVECADPAGPVACHGAHLTRLRVTALESRIDADLALERHREVVDELSGLVAGNPWHEPWWPRLMLALDGAGRRADALYTYQRLRTLLVDGLGVEPGPEARRAHQRILRGEHPAKGCRCG
ncbi:AfsR/SARP family transcriptional regulator [Streptomycetaceae bacterium NBC_01309]